MKVEELAYKLSEIKTFNINNTEDTKVSFGSTIGYIKNETARTLRMALKPSSEFKTHSEWGIETTDAYLEIVPQEVVGPIFLGELYFRGSLATDRVTVIISEVR